MENGQEVVAPFIWIGGSIFLLLVLLGFMILLFQVYLKRITTEMEEKRDLERAYQQRLLSNSVEIQENERERIAADLHDNLIAQLHRIKLMNEQAGLNSLLADSISTARNISHDLTPPLLEQLSISDLIYDFIQPMKQHFQLVLHSSILYTIQLAKEQKLHLFRAFQELISNIIKHASASSILVTLRITPSYTCLIVEDDGNGFDPNKTNGLGLKNIELRSQLLGAKYRVKQNREKGIRSIIILKR